MKLLKLGILLTVFALSVAACSSTTDQPAVDAKGSARVKGLASMSLALTDIVQSGKTVSVSTKDWVKEAEATKKKDTGIIGGAAGIGAAIGAIAGGKKG